MRDCAALISVWPVIFNLGELRDTSHRGEAAGVPRCCVCICSKACVLQGVRSPSFVVAQPRQGAVCGESESCSPIFFQASVPPHTPPYHTSVCILPLVKLWGGAVAGRAPPPLYGGRAVASDAGHHAWALRHPAAAAQGRHKARVVSLRAYISPVRPGRGDAVMCGSRRCSPARSAY